MGACCSGEIQSTDQINLSLRTDAKRLVATSEHKEAKYDTSSAFEPSSPLTKIKLAVHPNEMTLGTWNCGWSCEGAGLYASGCESGLNEFYKSWG